MSVTINASTSSGLVQTADTSGTLQLQSNGTTQLTVSSSGVAISNASLTNFAGGAITASTAVASTSGTAIDFTSIPSWVKRITVMFNGVSTSGTSYKLVQIGSGSVTTTGYVSASGGIYGGAGFSVASSTAGFVINSADAADNLYGSVVINLVTGNTYGAYGTLGDVTGTYVNAYTVSGGVTLSGILNMVRVTTVNGTDTFDAGSINILYEG